MLHKNVGATWIALFGALCSGLVSAPPVHAQNPEDALIRTIRTQSTIPDSDIDRIRRWIEAEIEALQTAADAEREAKYAQFMASIRTQYNASDATARFREAFASQLSKEAVRVFGRPNTVDEVSSGLARLMLDMNRAETIDGFIAGLSAGNAEARFLSARGLEVLRQPLTADADKLQTAIEALRAAGVKETDPIALNRIYSALSMPNQIGAVFPVIMAIFDARLESRRTGEAQADGAEGAALEFFRRPAVQSGLNAQQKQQLVERLAVFFRADAQRYNRPDMGPGPEGSIDVNFYERDYLERSLVATEDILTSLVSGTQKKIEPALRNGGWGNRQVVLDAVIEWVGSDDPPTQGTLNAAPWNVSVGAP